MAKGLHRMSDDEYGKRRRVAIPPAQYKEHKANEYKTGDGKPVRTQPYALKFSFKPGRGHRVLYRRPVPDAVIHASRISSPPKHMLETSRSGTEKCSTVPSGAKAEIPPLIIVATHTVPDASTAKLSTN